MLHVNIWGAGELGATLARRLAESGVARRIALIDEDQGRARGKALDLMQAGPSSPFDALIEGFGAAADAPAASLWVLADPPELEHARSLEAALALAEQAGGACFVVARERGAADLVEALARRARADRVLGSAPIAHGAALRLRLAHELGVERGDVAAMALGSPPEDVVVPSALVGGLALERLSPVALRRALQGLERRALGPVALAAAALRAIRALHAARESVQPALVVLGGEYGHRGVALAVPARLGRGRVAGIVELPLDPSDRVRFDRAAERRQTGRARRS
ncbi:MAG: hypothetical protein AB7O37_09660 [Vicinamibacteria bacterium]